MICTDLRPIQMSPASNLIHNTTAKPFEISKIRIAKTEEQGLWKKKLELQVVKIL